MVYASQESVDLLRSDVQRMAAALESIAARMEPEPDSLVSLEWIQANLFPRLSTAAVYARLYRAKVKQESKGMYSKRRLKQAFNL